MASNQNVHVKTKNDDISNVKYLTQASRTIYEDFFIEVAPALGITEDELKIIVSDTSGERGSEYLGTLVRPDNPKEVLWMVADSMDGDSPLISKVYGRSLFTRFKQLTGRDVAGYLAEPRNDDQVAEKYEPDILSKKGMEVSVSDSEVNEQSSLPQSIIAGESETQSIKRGVVGEETLSQIKKEEDSNLEKLFEPDFSRRKSELDIRHNLQKIIESYPASEIDDRVQDYVNSVQRTAAQSDIASALASVKMVRDKKIGANSHVGDVIQFDAYNRADIRRRALSIVNNAKVNTITSELDQLIAESKEAGVPASIIEKEIEPLIPQFEDRMNVYKNQKRKDWRIKLATREVEETKLKIAEAKLNQKNKGIFSYSDDHSVLENTTERAVKNIRTLRAAHKGTVAMMVDLKERNQPVLDSDIAVVDATKEVLESIGKRDSRNKVKFDRSIFQPERASVRDAVGIEIARLAQQKQLSKIIAQNIQARLITQGINPNKLSVAISHSADFAAEEIVTGNRYAGKNISELNIFDSDSNQLFFGQAKLDLAINDDALTTQEREDVSNVFASAANEVANQSRGLTPAIGVEVSMTAQGDIAVTKSETIATKKGKVTRNSLFYATEANTTDRVSRRFLGQYANGMTERELQKAIRIEEKRKLESGYWDSDNEARLKLLKDVYGANEEGRKLSAFLLSNEINTLTKKGALWYGLSAPVRIPFFQLAPDNVKAKYIEMQKRKEGPPILTAYKTSLNVPGIFSNVIKQEFLLATPFYGLDNKNRMYNRIFSQGYKGVDRVLDRFGEYGHFAYLSKLNQVDGLLAAGKKVGFRDVNSLGFRRRFADTLDNRKKKGNSLMSMLLKLSVGAAGGALVEAGTQALRTRAFGNRMLNFVENSSGKLRGEIQGMRNAWNYGKGWASRDMLDALKGELSGSQGILGYAPDAGAKIGTASKFDIFKAQTKYGAGRFIRGLNTTRAIGGTFASSFGKGYFAYVISALTGMPLPIAMGIGAMYGLHSFASGIANNPVLGIGVQNTGEFAALQNGALAGRYKLFKWLSEALYKGEGFNLINRTALQKFVRYLPTNTFLFGSTLAAIGVNPIAAYSIGLFGDVGLRVARDLVASRFMLPSQFGLASKYLGVAISKLGGVFAMMQGLSTLDEMGGFQNILQAGISLTTAFRVMGVLGLLMGGAVFGLPGLAVAGGILFVDTLSQLIFDRSLLSYVRPIWDSVSGTISDALQGTISLLIGLFKIFTAKDLQSMIEGVVSTMAGVLIVSGIFVGGVVAATFFIPSIPEIQPESTTVTSPYFRDVTKTLVKSENLNGKTELTYKITYTYTGGPEKNEDMIGVARFDEVTGIDKSMIDGACSGFVGSYTGFSYIEEGSRIIFADKGQLGLGLYDNLAGGADVKEFLHLGQIDIDQPVEFEFKICLNDTVGNLNLSGHQATFSNLFTIKGVPVPPTQYGQETLPSNYNVETASAQDTRNNKLEKVGFANPLPDSNACIISPFGNREDPFNPGNIEKHEGLDLAVNQGTPIHAVAVGTVLRTGYQAKGDGGAGNYVVIDHGNGIFSKYFHMLDTPEVSSGDAVNESSIIGFVGSTGNSTGPHLHLQINVNDQWKNAQDPCNYIDCSAYKTCP